MNSPKKIFGGGFTLWTIHNGEASNKFVFFFSEFIKISDRSRSWVVTLPAYELHFLLIYQTEKHFITVY